jgi:hypothetical protein
LATGKEAVLNSRSFDVQELGEGNVCAIPIFEISTRQKKSTVLVVAFVSQLEIFSRRFPVG